MKTVFCNVGWLKYYSGSDYKDEYIRPFNGGDFNNRNIGHEVCNFRSSDGACYGFVQPPGRGETLHHDKNLDEKFNEQGNIEHIRVIWLANPKNTSIGRGSRIVGWYNDAIAYAEYQQNPYMDDIGYFFKASAENCVLLQEQDRTFRFTKNIRNIWYVKDPQRLSKQDQDLYKSCDQYILAYSNGMIHERVVKSTNTKGESFFEGYTKHIECERRIRNSIVVTRAKESFASAHNGNVFCEVCGFDFSKRYGKIGKGFIEAHHITPFSESQLSSIKTSDFRMVCSNCHRMLHRDGNIGVDELKAIITSQ